ncbi:MAG: glycosyltransferase [Candidatus Omnitrophica bacterium]|nr:glycosyltransferase [Candidatus Omnitrophota bacterium]
MKIGILADELAPGSAPKLIGQPIKGLSSLGHNCEAVILIDNGIRKKFPEIYDYHLNGVKIRYLFNEVPFWIRKIDFKFPGFSFFSLHHILSFFIAPLIIKREEYDIIIAHCQYSAFAGWGLKIFRKIPYLLVVWDPSTYTLKKIYTKTPLKFFYPILYLFAWLLDKFSTKGARALITSGRIHHRRFTKISGRPLEDLYPACFTKEDFTPYSKREKAIITYDRWDIGNKPHIFLGLLEFLGKHIKLKIGGFWHPVSMEKDFLDEIKKRGLEDRVELLGPLDEIKIMDLCSRVVLHIHPNEEAFGMQTLEAAACGCCIIIPEKSGVTDLFTHGVHGYFPPKNNFKELVKYSNLILNDLKKAEEMGQKAWQVARKYNWEGHARRLAEIIERYA